MMKQKGGMEKSNWLRRPDAVRAQRNEWWNDRVNTEQGIISAVHNMMVILLLFLLRPNAGIIFFHY